MLLHNCLVNPYPPLSQSNLIHVHFVPKSYSTQSGVNRPQDQTPVVFTIVKNNNDNRSTSESKLILISIIDGVVFL